MRAVDRLVGRQPNVEPAERAEAVAIVQTQSGSEPMEALSDFHDYVKRGYYQSGIVHAVISARARVLSEVEFRYRSLADGALFGTPDLQVLEEPWPGAGTGDLVWRMEQDASLSGNAYIHRTNDGWLQRLDPANIQIVHDGRWKAGYLHWPDGIGNGRSTFLPVEDVAHYAPIPDPLRPFVGMSWLTPVASEVLGDQEMERHRRKFFANAATPNLVVKVQQALDPDSRAMMEEALSRKFASVENAYKSMIVDRGADVSVVGSNFQDMAFADLQGLGEIRVCQAAGVPPQLVGTQLGLKSSTFTNYTQAFRWYVDGTLRPAWRSMASSLQQVVPRQDGAELFYDDRHVAALQQDAKDQADIFDANARTIGALIRAGWTPESARDAVVIGDFGGLQHTGLMPVTLHEEEAADTMSPGDEDAEPGDPNEDI